MNEQEVMKKAFSQLHASDDTLQKVLNQAHNGKCRKFAPRRFAILVAAVIAVCSLALVVQGTVFVLLGNHVAVLSPAENPGTFIDDVYDVTLTPAPEMLDNHGNPIPMPDMEQPNVNVAEAEKWLSQNINDISGVASVGDNTFTMKNFMVDENGTGVFTWTVENPNGIPYLGEGCYKITFSPIAPFGNPLLYHYDANGQEKISTVTFDRLVSQSADGTKLEVATFFSTVEEYEVGDHFVWEVYCNNNVKDTIQITPNAHIPIKTLTAPEGMWLKITNHSIAIDMNSHTCTTDPNIIVYFKDGSQYCVRDRDIMIDNSIGGLWRKSEEYFFDEIVDFFHQLIDINEISHVRVEFTSFEDVIVGEKTEVLSHTHNYNFYP